MQQSEFPRVVMLVNEMGIDLRLWLDKPASFPSVTSLGAVVRDGGLARWMTGLIQQCST